MKVFRENPDVIFEDLKRRNASDKIAKDVVELDKKWRKFIEEGNTLRALRNSISKEIGELKKNGKNTDSVLKKMSGIKDKIIQNEKNTKDMLELLCDLWRHWSCSKVYKSQFYICSHSCHMELYVGIFVHTVFTLTLCVKLLSRQQLSVRLQFLSFS